MLINFWIFSFSLYPFSSYRCVVIPHHSLIWISLKTDEIGCLDIGLGHLGVSSVKCLFMSFAHFSTECLTFSHWFIRSFLYNLDAKSLLIMLHESSLSLSVSCHSTYCALFSYFYFLKIFIYLREKAQVGGGAEGDADSPWAGTPMRGSIPGLQDHDLSWRQTLNWLSHPGSPDSKYLLIIRFKNVQRN